MIKLSLACFVLFFGGLAIADNIPVFIWGPFNHYTPAIALKSYNSDEFIDILSEHVTSETFTLVISEDKLSTEDLTQCKTADGKTCFQNIQQIKTKLYLTSVEDPVQVIEDVAGLDKTEVTLLSNGALSKPLDPEGGKYVFINFEDSTNDESKYSKLTRHDQLIKQLYNELSSQDLQLMIVYTGKRAEHQKRRIVRQAPTAASSTSATVATPSVATSAPTSASTAATVKPKQDTEAGGIFWKRDRLLLYYTSLESVDQTGTATEIVIDRVELDPQAGTRVGVTMFAGTTSLAFNITGEGGYWGVEEIKYTTNGNEQPLTTDTRIAALDTFSFHCSPVIQLTNTQSRNVVLRWHGIQIQPEFGTVAGQTFDSFGDSWDCVGFVSPGIIGGLFVVIMLLIILSIGISFMMDINTMDRFDDPKGKTITINVNE